MKFPLILRQNPIKSYRQWKEALNNLTPLDHAQAKKEGHFFAMLGAICASSSLLLQVIFVKGFLPMTSTFGFGLLVGAIGYIQFSEWRKERQKIIGIKKMNETMGDNNGTMV